MDCEVSLDNIVAEIRSLGSSLSPVTEENVERFLDDRLTGVSLSEKLRIIERLMGRFEDSGSERKRSLDLKQEDAERLFTLMLGPGFGGSDHLSGDLPERLVDSVNTVFDSLNQIIGVIHNTLLGRKPELETIRHVIGSQIEQGEGAKSWEIYLNQIKQAFLASHNAFQQSACSIVKEMLCALDPDVLANVPKPGLKFGPLRKAEIFDAYRDKYGECRRWFDEGHFSEKLLREFEKICQRSFKAD